uniref:Uncharacterized protein n=1 Tax=Anguilla anguilla TaxID=7936 RepID=A0A0E9RKH3_ANGAN
MMEGKKTECGETEILRFSKIMCSPNTVMHLQIHTQHMVLHREGIQSQIPVRNSGK